MPADAEANQDDAAAQPAGLSRRGLLGLLGAGSIGAALGAGGTLAATAPAAEPRRMPFHGAHQQGIASLAPDSLVLASLDMSAGATREDLRELLADWTFAASRLTQGLEVSSTGTGEAHPEAPPDDSGEALDLDAANLTITVGLGPDLFDDRFGLADRRPAALLPIPAFPEDLLEASAGGGDLCIQACAEDPQVALHAVRNLLRIAFGRAQVRWLQTGFNHADRSAPSGSTPRNLLGFKDGTANIDVDDDALMREHVWVDGDDQAWLEGGTYLVMRKIRMTIEAWDRTRLSEQEVIFGRDKVHGAPLTGGEEHDALDLDAYQDGEPVIATLSHVRLAHHSQNDGVRILRRPFNYVDGVSEVGQLDAGLVFLSFQRDPAQFVTLQRALRGDLLAEYIRHVGSAVFAVPPGARDGESIAAALFD